MSSLDERLEDAYCPDSVVALDAQRELVADLLARRFRGAGPSRAAEPPLNLCHRCSHEVDEDLFCFLCGWTNTQRGGHE